MTAHILIDAARALSAAVDALLAQMDALGVERRQNVRVTALRREDGGFVLEGTESVYSEEKNKKNGKIKKGDLVIFNSMGAGFTWGGATASGCWRGIRPWWHARRMPVRCWIGTTWG